MPDYTTPTYTSPSASSSSTGWYDWVDLALRAKAYQDSKKAPKFAQVPPSPEQRELLQMYMRSMNNPALKDNAKMVNERAGTILGGYGDLGWQSPKTFSGDVGYKGTRSPFQGMATAPPPKPTAAGQGSAVDRPNMQPMTGPGGAGSGSFAPMNRLTPVDGGNMIPGARMPETSAARNVGMSGLATSTDPTAGGRMLPSMINGGQMEYGSLPEMRSFASFLSSQGIKDAMKVAIGLFSGGLQGAALTAAKVLYDRWQSTERSALPQSGATLPQGPGVRP